MTIFIFRSVFVYIILAALSERFSESSKFVALPNFFSEKVSSTNILRHLLAVLLKRKYCLTFVMSKNFAINCEFDL